MAGGTENCVKIFIILGLAVEHKQAHFSRELLPLNPSPLHLRLGIATTSLLPLFPADLSDNSDCKLKNTAKSTLSHPKVFWHHPNIHNHYEDLEVNEKK